MIHKAFIDVNEQGSEAAAATAIVMDDCESFCEPTTPVEFRVDRPFMFAIHECRQGMILFQGKYLSSRTIQA